MNIKATKRTKKYYITILPIIVVMITIFLFSSRNADESGEDSSKIVEVVENIYEWVTDKEYTEPDTGITLSLLVRKLAHFSEYCLLAICVMIHMFEYKVKNMTRFVTAVIFSGVYAMTDEFHQRFVPGRVGAWADVAIDTAGAVTGAAVVLLIITIYNVIRKRKEAASELI